MIQKVAIEWEVNSIITSYVLVHIILCTKIYGKQKCINFRLLNLEQLLNSRSSRNSIMDGQLSIATAKMFILKTIFNFSKHVDLKSGINKY